MIKTRLEDFSISAIALLPWNNALGTVIDKRQSEFTTAVEYEKKRNKFEAVYNEIVAAVGRELALRLEEAVNGLEVLNFTAGYKAGVTDLMVAQTFNRQGLTRVEYIDLSQHETKTESAQLVRAKIKCLL